VTPAQAAAKETTLALAGFHAGPVFIIYILVELEFEDGGFCGGTCQSNTRSNNKPSLHSTKPASNPAYIAPSWHQTRGPYLESPETFPVKPLQNLKPCDYRAVLFAYSKDGERFLSHKKFLKMALWAQKLSGAFEKRAPGPHCTVPSLLPISC